MVIRPRFSWNRHFLTHCNTFHKLNIAEELPWQVTLLGPLPSTTWTITHCNTFCALRSFAQEIFQFLSDGEEEFSAKNIKSFDRSKDSWEKNSSMGQMRAKQSLVMKFSIFDQNVIFPSYFCQVTWQGQSWPPQLPLPSLPVICWQTCPTGCHNTTAKKTSKQKRSKNIWDTNANALEQIPSKGPMKKGSLELRWMSNIIWSA